MHSKYDCTQIALTNKYHGVHALNEAGYTETLNYDAPVCKR